MSNNQQPLSVLLCRRIAERPRRICCTSMSIELWWSTSSLWMKSWWISTISSSPCRPVMPGNGTIWWRNIIHVWIICEGNKIWSALFTVETVTVADGNWVKDELNTLVINSTLIPEPKALLWDFYCLIDEDESLCSPPQLWLWECRLPGCWSDQDGYSAEWEICRGAHHDCAQVLLPF